MTERQDKIFGFGAMVACTGAVAAAMSWAMFIGFVLGVITTMGAAAVVGTHDGDG
jgi:Asp/Glu/hydantoin racemase